MTLKIAEISDIEAVLKLHRKYQVASIKEEDKKDGFVTTAFTKEELTQLIEEEQGLFIAKESEEVLAYVMAASWQFWSQWPMFAHMIKDLPNLEYLGEQLSVENSYQYGPICIDKSVRGTSILPEIFDFARVEMAKRYPILVTFVNKINPRSYEAHTRKLGLTVIQEFDYNNNHYYEMVYDTSKPVSMMREHTVNQDSQELIEDLGKAGGGLSKSRAMFLRYVGFPLLNSVISWERALDIFEKEGAKVISLAKSLDEEQLFKRVLVPKLFGLEDNSRYYSVAMVLEHLCVVGEALQNRVPLLSQGKTLDKEVKIEDYKPYVEIDSSIIGCYEKFLSTFRKTLEENCEDIYLDNRHEHPWFGNLKAKDWAVMGTIHQIVHRRQIEAIIRGS